MSKQPLTAREWIVAAAIFEARGDEFLRQIVEDQIENRFAEEAPCVRLTSRTSTRLLLEIHAEIQAQLDVIRPWRAARPCVEGVSYDTALYLAEEWRDAETVSRPRF